jgi:hypothetical protein
MDQVRVNLTLDQIVWGKFNRLVPKREKSSIINALIKEEIARRERLLEEQKFSAAFSEAAQDKDRLKSTNEWEGLDQEVW